MMPKKLTIQHDGKLTVSTFGTLALGDVPLSSVVADALNLRGSDYKDFEAEVFISFRFKDKVPKVQWEGDESC